MDFLVDNDLLPLTSILIEPAKVLFLNNAINHGVLTPLGTTQALQTGKSILFLLEANPGPGLGILLAYMVFGKGVARASAPGAAIIQFFGGIHEIYFPYVLMKPKLIIATILGGMTGVFINVLFGSGLRAPAAPGSIIAVYAQTASGSFLGVTLSVFGAAAVSFTVASLLLKTDRPTDERRSGRRHRGDGGAQRQEVQCGCGTGRVRTVPLPARSRTSCSPATPAWVRRRWAPRCCARRCRRRGLRRRQGHQPADLQPDRHLRTRRVPPGPDRPRQPADTVGGARLGRELHEQPRYDEIVEQLGQTNGARRARPLRSRQPRTPRPTTCWRCESIVLDGYGQDTRTTRSARRASCWSPAGAVEPAYVDAMHEREGSVSTYMGNGLAIPHGTNEAKDSIRHTGISFVRYTEPIDWNGKPAEFVVGIAGAGKDHMALLTRIAEVFLNKDEVARLRDAEEQRSRSRPCSVAQT